MRSVIVCLCVCVCVHPAYSSTGNPIGPIEDDEHESESERLMNGEKSAQLEALLQRLRMMAPPIIRYGAEDHVGAAGGMVGDDGTVLEYDAHGMPIHPDGSMMHADGTVDGSASGAVDVGGAEQPVLTTTTTVEGHDDTQQQQQQALDVQPQVVQQVQGGGYDDHNVVLAEGGDGSAAVVDGMVGGHMEDGVVHMDAHLHGQQQLDDGSGMVAAAAATTTTGRKRGSPRAKGGPIQRRAIYADEHFTVFKDIALLVGSLHASVKHINTVPGYERLSRNVLRRYLMMGRLSDAERRLKRTGRPVNNAFDEDVRDRLLGVPTHDHDGNESNLPAMEHTPGFTGTFSYSSIQRVARELQASAKWANDRTVGKLKFSNKWVRRFLIRYQLAATTV